MKIFDQYILKQFLVAFVWCIIVFYLVFLLVDIIEDIDYYIDNNAKLKYIASYYFYFSPYIIILILPLCTLFAATLTCSILSKNMETVAIRSAGVSTIRIALPLIISGLIISIFSLFFAELVMPTANTRRDFIKENKISRQGSRRREVKRDFIFKGDDRQLFHFDSYNIQTARGENVTIQAFGRDNRLVLRMDASEMYWNNGLWVFKDLYIRAFEGSTATTSHFDERSYSFAEEPSDFAAKVPDPDQMGFFELREYIRNIRSWGGDPQKELVDLYMKTSFPFANFILLLLSLPLTLIFRRSGLVLGLGQSLLIAFIYYSIIRAGQAVGYNGQISPFLAAYAGNLLFLTAGGGFLFAFKE